MAERGTVPRRRYRRAICLSCEWLGHWLCDRENFHRCHPLHAEPDFDENVSLARFANLLSRDGDDHRIAQTALKFAAAPQVAKSRLSSVGGLLLAEQEIGSDPLHIAIVGKRDDVAAQKLFAAALAYPVIYKQVEWIEPHQKDSIYPELPQSAAYTCTGRACSAPVFDETHLVALLDRKTAARK